MEMLFKVCLLLLCVGVYASRVDYPESTTGDELFEQLDVFPKNFISKFPKESEFFRLKIFAYVFFSIFSKYLAENEPLKFWSSFNQNNFKRVIIDAAFYGYLTECADEQPLVLDSLESSTSRPEDIAMDRIGDYLDNLSEPEVTADQSETVSPATVGFESSHSVCATLLLRDPSFGIPGKDFPNYCDIPKTSFTCANKLVPGVYADVETGCQVFHACWPNRIDSFLCPIGTTFNQALLTCDFWHESDCSSLLHFHPLYAKSRTPEDVEPTIEMDDETRTTPESSSDFTELDTPEFDGTCKSIMSEPLRSLAKFAPAKCQVRDLEPSATEATDETSKYDGKHPNRLTGDFMTGTYRDPLGFIIMAAERGGSDPPRMQGPALRLMLKMEESTLKSDHGVEEATTEFASTHVETDTMVEEQLQHSTTEVPLETSSKRKNSKFLEKTVFKPLSTQEKLNRWSSVKSVPLKPIKMSEDSKKRVLDLIMRSVELGGKILSEIVPFVEKIVLDNPMKKDKFLKKPESDVE